MIKKICVVVASRANYGRVKSLLLALKEQPDVDLQIIAGASFLLDRYGNGARVLEKDGLKLNRRLYYALEGETLETQSKSTGLGLIDLTTAFSELTPDFVVTIADRYETIATAIAATYLNIPLIHLQGGEVSGNIDDRVRNAITKLADFHFVATENSRRRVIAMGEDEATVFNYGCPAMDLLKDVNKKINNKLMRSYGGVGSGVDWQKPYILMIQHPVTTSFGDGFWQVNETLNALIRFPELQKIVLWPNSDAGSDDVAKGIRIFREEHSEDKFHYFRNFSPEDFIRVLANAKCCIGNSSSFIREASHLGVPAVIVGDRQREREHGENVVFANYDEEEIVSLLQKQLGSFEFRADSTFGNGNAGELIAKKIPTLDTKLLKKAVML